MKLVVGLGNPGRKYAGTRHNVGFEVLADLAERFGQGSARARFEGEVVEAGIAGEKVVLLGPRTFMNRSGASVVLARDFYKLSNAELLVVCDDFNLPLARLRMRAKGSAGGQKGLADILRRLGGEDVPRLRIGVGEPPPGRDPADYVLSKFRPDERPEAEAAIWRASDAVEAWVRDGIERAMNETNSTA